jgi:DNA-binding NarL/FixJ family response regulator
MVVTYLQSTLKRRSVTVITSFALRPRDSRGRGVKQGAIAVLNVANKRPENRFLDLLILTTREREVVRLVSGGLSNKLVARHLGLREGTVKIHLHNVYRKLRIPNRMTLIATGIGANNNEMGL